MVAGTDVSDAGPVTFHGASNTVIDWHVYLKHLTKLAVLWFPGTVMGEVRPVTFLGGSNTLVGWHGYGRGQGHVTFHGASALSLTGTIMGVVGARNNSRSFQYYGWLARL